MELDGDSYNCKGTEEEDVLQGGINISVSCHPEIWNDYFMSWHFDQVHMMIFFESQWVFKSLEHKKNLNSNDALIEHVEPFHVIEEDTNGHHIFLKSTKKCFVPNKKFKVSGVSSQYNIVEFNKGDTGYIHNSRVVEYW